MSLFSYFVRGNQKKADPIYVRKKVENLVKPEFRPRHLNSINTVLVEEEERVRRFWKEFFEQRSMPLTTFQNEDEFLRHLPEIGSSTQFYFDQDIGQKIGVGVELARLIKNIPVRQSTYLVTAYPKTLFEKEIRENTLDSVFSKYPDHIFGVNFLESRMRREISEKGLEPLLKECLGGISQALGYFEVQMEITN